MAWFAMVLAHLLVLFLVFVMPYRGIKRYETLKRRVDRHPELRRRFYVQGMLSQWLLLVPLAVIVFGLGWSGPVLGLQAPANLWLWGPIALVLILLIYAQVFAMRRLTRTADGIGQLRESLAGPLHMLPRTALERALWVPLSLTAGVCEEVLYRGFLPAYLVHVFPGVSLLLGVIIAAVLFCIGHFYVLISVGRFSQKMANVLGIGVIGLVFGFLYYFTGSLLLPIIVHALLDMRLVFIDVPGLVNASNSAKDAEASAAQPL